MVMLLGFRKFVDISCAKTLMKSFSTAHIVLANKPTQNFRKDIVIRNIDEKQESPLMVIVGWSNSKNKQVAKYSKLYEQQGLTTISISCRMYRFAMFYDSLFAKDTKACIDALQTQRNLNKDRKVFFKLFSTPGPAMYVNIMNYYYQYIQGHFGTDCYQNENTEDVPNISGVIFDSPTVGSGTAEQFAEGMKANFDNPVADIVAKVLGNAVYQYAVRNSKMHNYGPEFFRNMPVLIPQLMLYSKSDKIAGYQAIVEYIEQQKSVGASIESRMWEDSAHVVHYRNFPEEYESLVSRFVENCVTSEEWVSAIPKSQSKIYSVVEEQADAVEEVSNIFSRKQQKF